jgi:hypothetical protein
MIQKMKSVFKWFCTFVILTYSSLSVHASSPCRDQIDSCEYYRCISNQLGCRNHDYFIGFGEKYCKIYLKSEPQYTSEGQAFLQTVRHCLKDQIETSYDEFTCKNAKSIAISKHVDCYIYSGYCQLGNEDKSKVFVSALASILTEPLIIQTGLEVEQACSMIQ